MPAARLTVVTGGAGFIGSHLCDALVADGERVLCIDDLSTGELVERVVRLTGTRAPVVLRPLPADDPRRRKPDITRATERLGWSPRISLEEGLERTIAWFQSQLVDSAAWRPWQPLAANSSTPRLGS